MKRKIIRCLILACSFLLLLSACGKKPPAGETVPVPPVGNFAMQNLVSEFPGEIRTAKYADQVQLVVFFRSDDPACRGSIADWNALQKEFADRGFTLVGAVADDRKPDVIGAEVVALDPAWPVGLAAAPVVEAFGGPAAIRAIPTFFLLDRDGQVARSYAGFVPLATLRADIGHLLDGQPLAPAAEPAP